MKSWKLLLFFIVFIVGPCSSKSLRPIVWVQSGQALDIQAARNQHAAETCTWLSNETVSINKATTISPLAQHSTQTLPKSRQAESFCHQCHQPLSKVPFWLAKSCRSKSQRAGYGSRTYDVEWKGFFFSESCIVLYCSGLPHSCEFIHHTHQPIYSCIRRHQRAEVACNIFRFPSSYTSYYHILSLCDPCDPVFLCQLPLGPVSNSTETAGEPGGWENFGHWSLVAWDVLLPSEVWGHCYLLDTWRDGSGGASPDMISCQTVGCGCHGVLHVQPIWCRWVADQ